MNLKTVFVNGLRKQSVRIACIQLASPFYRDIEQIRNDQSELTFGITAKCEARFKKRTERIHRMINEVLRSTKPDFIVLPEYTFLKNDHAILGETENSVNKCMKRVHSHFVAT